jgi:hypothetical protein
VLSQLATVVLPDSLGLRRDHVVPPDRRGPGYDDRYDFLTLTYDAVHLPERDIVALYCPKLLNLSVVLDRGEVTLDGTPVRPRRVRRYKRYDIVELPGMPAARSLGLRYRDWQAEVPVSPAENDAFAGTNCLMTMSRNNALPWIADWARYHVAEHGADAVLIFDNGSTDYPEEAVDETLAAVPGLKALRVVPADRPYGPLGIGRGPSKGFMLKAALQNIARGRFLARARAVLVCDIDELVVARRGGSVFDAAAASRAGYLKFRGTWRLPATPPGVMPRHRDHVLRAEPSVTCPAKFCVVPDGKLHRFSWGSHNLEGLWLSGRFETEDFTFLHCRGISDFWKGAASRFDLAPAGTDPEAEAVLARSFGAGDTDAARMQPVTGSGR